MIGLGRSARLVLIGLPFLWLALFFLVPLLIVVKISLAHSAIGIPPYTPLLSRRAGSVEFHATLANFLLLARDDLYLRAYLGSLGQRGGRYRVLPIPWISDCARDRARARRHGVSCCFSWWFCRSGPAF